MGSTSANGNRFFWSRFGRPGDVELDALELAGKVGPMVELVEIGVDLVVGAVL